MPILYISVNQKMQKTNSFKVFLIYSHASHKNVVFSGARFFVKTSLASINKFQLHAALRLRRGLATNSSSWLVHSVRS